MSYQVLARKWRPGTFDQVAGQAHVLKSLINALDNQRLHHAYLFTGTRGVGKTTLARILAKCLNCESGITSVPCDQCDSCREISEGRFIDLIEVDAASRTKVEDTRELLENVQYMPTRGRFKVYLIDEVHMLSNHSFNALLKTLEEPPEHVKFLFATTDPQKLPVTILSRCLQFNLKNLSPQIITEYLQHVLEQESIEFDEDALWQIAAAAAGSMRDALTLVDQAISYCQGRVAAAGVVEMLGIPQQRQVFDLLSAMVDNDVRSLLALVQDISEHTPDYLHTLDSLLSTLHRIAIAQVVPEATDNSFGDQKIVQEFAGKFSPDDIQLYYQMGSKGREDLRFAADLRSAFEMLLIRMLIFSPDYVAMDEKPTEDSVSPPEPNETSAAKPQESKSQKKKSDRPQPVEPAKNPPKTEPVARQVEDKPGTEDPATTLASLTHEKWLELYPQLELSGIVANVLANCVLVESGDKALVFDLDTSQAAVYSEELLPRLAQSLAEYFGQDISVRINIAEVSAETPAAKYQRVKQENYDAMVEDFEQDENVQELLKHFSGSVARDTIAPLPQSKDK